MLRASSLSSKFWCIVVKDGEVYSQTFENKCHITSAGLECKLQIGKGKRVSVKFRYNGAIFSLCSLTSSDRICRISDLQFNKGEVVKFHHNGKGCVYISGYAEVIHTYSYFERDVDLMLSQFKLLKKEKMKKENVVSESKKCLMNKDSEKPQVKMNKEKTEDGYDGEVPSLSIDKEDASITSSKFIDGMVIDDIIVGDGQEATIGSTVQIYYTARFENGNIFDCSCGVPCSFELGKDAVMKGWDDGVKGMKVGGQRKLAIPPGIGMTVNSTLYYEVELASIC